MNKATTRATIELMIRNKPITRIALGARTLPEEIERIIPQQAIVENFAPNYLQEFAGSLIMPTVFDDWGNPAIEDVVIEPHVAAWRLEQEFEDERISPTHWAL